MTSEIRVNKITHTAGVGTVTTNTHGIVVSGIVTATTFKGNVEATTGTFSGNLGVGGVLTYEDVTNIDSVGVITARGGIKIGPTAGVAGTFFADGSYVTAGVVTATTFHGSGANLTSLPAQATIANNADNRVITGGSGVNLNGEANLTFDGTSLLTVHVPSATGSPAINFTNSDTGTGTGNGFGIGLADNESPYIYNRENTDLRIATNNTERMRINAAGNVGINQTSPSDKLHVSGTTNFTGNSYIGGDLYMYGSSYTKGIFLGGSGSANKIDDYEQGNWTPDWRGGSALGTTSYGSYNSASYVKIGNQVTVRGFSMITGSSGGSGFWFINNLPFTCGGGDDRRFRSVGSVMIENFNFNSDVSDVVCFIERNNNDMQLRSNRDNAGAGANISVNNDTSFEIMFTITYQTV